MRVAVLIALAACVDSAPESVQVPEHQTVYSCAATFGDVEYCFDGTALELSRMVGALCVPSEDERFCVGPLGQCYPICLYCCGVDCPASGANAKNGAWCNS